ncbi:MATE family efflux transporter [Flammeovirga kamogawensis]|uniref:Multidrug-efflux transporter n=1 Tax=Flammeovirga kamogawensis TaxID=373891 RepID=A0ABX8H1X9_9BACT|nr:MATE family efflux transporter [Flammeovirga kamogawensis]MBB6463614.1 putative MATE family efflux protein [Flammeovirga kamogawensis]QWG09836.1 MATE family efflux transporter [Flammeovirga kamogawensis]TRX65343.1 MATE family efflux transporter [Flammeovirga kamogawensis]
MKKDLTNGPVLEGIVGLALPIIASSFLQFAYNFTDMLWVGQLGSNAVAAVGTSAFFLQLTWAFASVFLLGTGISVSHAIGNKENKKAQIIAREALFFLMLIVAIMIVIIQLFYKDLIGFFKLNDLLVEGLAYDYLRCASLGLLFILTVNLFTGISNARGDAKTPLKITIVGVVINILLDPIFIFVLDLGVLGAALATIIAQSVSLILFWNKTAQDFLGTYKEWKWSTSTIKETINLGFPPSIQRIVFTVVGIIMARIVAQWGSDAIAAQKIGLQIESMTFMATGGLMGAMMSFTGQNFGAKKYSRISEGYSTALKIGVSLGVVMGILFYSFPTFFVRLFVQEEATVTIGADYLRIIGLSQVFMCVEMITSGIINGLGKTKVPATINITMTLIRIPMAIYLSSFTAIGINGVWLAIAISTVLRATSLTVAYQIIKRKITLNRAI